ncbi:ABC transporter substrate-binding protein [Frondihabitans australicus]|uniref:Peptide/nickel transport system substrate-binding protein n=1 Tax=Frondihabitans australicus TaxID=386892 RepID=A0A495ILU3_9MICO|nr:ABC transporter substrate-binding protein [Frondihabitans australicus]RKR76095.1 peptide/nickel transport system substrate-binding protein [Frondihabitans australicus]
MTYPRRLERTGGPRRRALAAAVALAVAVTAAGCTSSDTTADQKGPTLTVDTAFDLTALDPGRMYESTGELIDHALYETLLTYGGAHHDDVTRVEPGLATLHESSDAKTFTLTLRGSPRFSDGTPLTADDVVFSLDRVIGLKAGPAFLLAGVRVKKRSPTSVVLTTAKPTPALPAILANPATGILNAKVVKAHGGTTGQGDTARRYLDRHSAGSGPYELVSSMPGQQVVLQANPDYAGPEPTYGRIVVRDAASTSQVGDLRQGHAQVALDLSPSDASGLGRSARVTATASSTLVFLFLNQDPTVSSITSNPYFVRAVKEALDYPALAKAAGRGARQANGVVPSLFVGALPDADALTQNTAAAKSDLSLSGYAGQQITLDVPSDVTVGGVSLTELASRVSDQLAAVGIDVAVDDAPQSTQLDDYRNGLEQAGLWYWGADYPDPSDYLGFTPGGALGTRAGWGAGADDTVTDLATLASRPASSADRASRFGALQRALNATGPFVPLIQPAATIAARPRVTGVAYNPVWTLDLATLGRAKG